jgi:hypothetical protein
MKLINKSDEFTTLDLTLTGGLGVLGGIWLIINPFILDYNSLTGKLKVGGDNATLVSIISGVILIALSLFCIAIEKQPSFFFYRFYAGIATIFLGLFLLVSPQLLNFYTTGYRDPLWALQITGGLIVLIAGFVVQEVYNRYQAHKAQQS